MAIATNIRCVKVGATEDAERVNDVYLVMGERAAFVDSGWDDDAHVESIVATWEDAGRPEVAAIIVTHRHRDHAGGAAKLAQATGGPVVCSPVEKPFIKETGATVGWTLADGEILDLGGVTLEMVHTPGHTMGSLCVFHREERVLFTGDTILGTGTTTINRESGDMGMFLQSLEKLLRYDARMIAPGHGPMVDEPEAMIRKVIRRRLERERQVLDALAESPSTPEQIFELMYSGLDPQLRQAAIRQIESHIVKLERDGRVAASKGESGEYALTA